MAALATGCGGGFSRQNAIDGFLAGHPEADAAQAACVVDRLTDRYGADELQTRLDAEEMSAEFEEAQFRDMFACGLEGDVSDQITEQLVNNGVSESDAPCVADALVADLDDADIDVLLSGQITDAFYQKFFAAMDSCGAVNQESP